jgi:hypothetical protein
MLNDAEQLSIARSCIRYLRRHEFLSKIFSPARTSLEPSSPDPADFGKTGFNFETQFERPQNIAENRCILIAQWYPFYDYAATRWAEHYSACERIAPESVRDAVRKLTTSPSYALVNWLRYYWIKNRMECPFLDRFETVKLAAFFNFSVLLAESLGEEDVNSEVKVRALYWAARRSSLMSLRV